ncbi:MAG: esterase family protein [Pirellulales bacterium]|nr:esterase family protein [Pirellulales bacterium]
MTFLVYQLRNAMGEVQLGWETIEIGGHQTDVFQPDRPHSSGHVVIYLHGVHLGRLRGNGPVTELLRSTGLACVAPMTGPSWWLDVVCPAFDAEQTPEAHLRKNVLPWIKLNFGQKPPLVGLIGTSMGGQGAIRLALKSPQDFPVAAGLAPAVDFHTWMADGDPILGAMFESVEAARQETALLQIQPLNWPRHLWFCCDPEDDRWWDSSDKLAMKLSSMGVPYECDLETSAGGHGWDYYNQMFAPALEFVVRGLQSEQRRLSPNGD